jgi:DNA-binding Lrp family transcriptional regulator
MFLGNFRRFVAFCPIRLSGIVERLHLIIRRFRLIVRRLQGMTGPLHGMTGRLHGMTGRLHGIIELLPLCAPELEIVDFGLWIAEKSLHSPRMDSLLKLIRQNAAWKAADLAAMLNLPESEVAARIKRYETEGVILGYRAIVNEEKLGVESVRVVIEVKITPERGGGFDRLAERIAKYSEVQSCYLMSGGYDLLVVVQGNGLREVATFVSEKLATIQGVISTATHFMLKPYKEQGVLMKMDVNEERLAVSP